MPMNGKTLPYSTFILPLLSLELGGENNIGAPKMRDDFCAFKLFIFP